MRVYVRKRCNRCNGRGEADCNGDGYVEEEEGDYE